MKRKCVTTNQAVETAALVETVEKQTALSHRSHSAWETRPKNVEFPTVPTASTAQPTEIKTSTKKTFVGYPVYLDRCTSKLNSRMTDDLESSK